MEIMGAFLTLATAGVFDRYPALRFAFLESGCGWLPNWLERMVVLAENPYYRQGYQGQVKPSEYFRRGQCYISSEAEESATVAMLGRTITEDCLMWASDYPHRDAVPYFPNTVGGVLANEHLSRAFKQKVLWESPARFYDLQLECSAAQTPRAASAVRH
jgi:predicted TIM-barrel fold metal-dependent hydrolase